MLHIRENVFLLLSGFAMLLAVLGSVMFVKRKKSTFLKPIHLLSAGVFLASFFFFIPIYGISFSGISSGRLLAVLIAIHNTLRLFVLDGEFSFVTEYVARLGENAGKATLILGAVLYVAAPVMTFGVVLSLFRNLSAYWRYYSHYFADVYVFSDLNSRSIALADSIRKCKRSSLILFTDVFEKEDENTYELVEKARRMGAVLFKDDLRCIQYRFHSPKRHILFFIMGDSEEENVAQLSYLHSRFKDRAHTRVYIFSDSIVTKMALQKVTGGKLHVQMISPNGVIICDLMYSRGEELFENAVPEENGKKRISVVLLGLDGFGMEMLRTLPWLCQMYGYRFTIYGFDKDYLCASRFAQMCPELMDPNLNGPEKEYDIRLFPGVNVETAEFSETVLQLPVITQVYISLGSSQRNVNAAVLMRMLCQRKKQYPNIKALLSDSREKEVLTGVSNFKGQSYGIDYIGDIDSVYSEKVIMHSALEKEALERHLKWGKEEEFWCYSYHYRSSMASAIHMRLREKCGMPGAGKKETELTEQERNQLEILEHRRWNAYMRCEGYIFSGSLEKESRDDLAQMHHNLTSFENLCEKDKRKDSSVGSK